MGRGKRIALGRVRRGMTASILVGDVVEKREMFAYIESCARASRFPELSPLVPGPAINKFFLYSFLGVIDSSWSRL